MLRIGIRREDKNEWERRAPLTPDHVAEAVETLGLEVAVQPSKLRVFPDRDYRAAGAAVEEDLSGCRVILGIKEIPPERLLCRGCAGCSSGARP
jgi:alpha-aminoadipic semialdehyde synthase